LQSRNSSISGKLIPIDLSLARIPLPSSGKNVHIIIKDEEQNFILDKLINITPKIEFDVQPKFAYPGIKTKFVATSNQPAIKVEWTIEVEKSETTLPEKEYIFSRVGEYEIKVNYFSSSGNAIKNFTIKV